MTNLEVGLIISIASGTLGVLGKMMFDKTAGKIGKSNDVKPVCSLDRSSSIFQIGEIHATAKEANDLAKNVKNTVDQNLALTQRNSENMNNLYIALNNMIIHQKQLIEVQQKTNEILTSIKKNGSGIK